MLRLRQAPPETTHVAAHRDVPCEHAREDTDAIIVRLNKPQVVRRLNARMALVGLPTVTGLFALFAALKRASLSTDLYAADALFFGLPWLVALEWIVLYAIVLRANTKQTKPVATISRDGITVHTIGQNIGLLRWNEIADIRAYNFVHRYVGIVPKNMDAVCRRIGGRRAFMLRLNQICLPLYKPFGIFVAPINIPQEYLPISADALMTRIAAFQLTQADEQDRSVRAPA